LLSVAACKDAARAAAKSAEAETILTEAQTAASAKNAAWSKALAGAKTTAAPRPDLGKCPVDIGFPPSLTLLGVQAFLRDAGVDTDPPPNVAVYLTSDIATASSPRMRQFDFEAQQLRQRRGRFSDMGDDALVANAKTIGDMGYWSWDIALVLDLSEDTRVDIDAKTFRSGVRAGYAYVYDYAKGAIVCAGSFVATNSETLWVKWRKGEEKNAGKPEATVDLDMHTAELAYKSLVAAGPASSASDAGR
jgi:hypothetical protein